MCFECLALLGSQLVPQRGLRCVLKSSSNRKLTLIGLVIECVNIVDQNSVGSHLRKARKMMRAAGKNFGVVRKAAQKRSFSQSPHDQPQHYDAPVPVTKNFIMAGVLAVFAGSVYYYTVKRIQIVSWRSSRVKLDGFLAQYNSKRGHSDVFLKTPRDSCWGRNCNFVQEHFSCTIFSGQTDNFVNLYRTLSLEPSLRRSSRMRSLLIRSKMRELIVQQNIC